MSLTMGGGPLVARDPPDSNYAIEGPTHRILWSEFPRRVRAELGGATVLDTTGGRLLHESQMLPVLYVPEGDVATELLEPTATKTFCPFKGEASYRSVRAGDRVAEDAVWSYLEPNEESLWLAGHLAFYWRKLDAWYDEDEEVHGHLRDPFHRVDARASSRRVVVRVAGEETAATGSPVILSETGLPNRIYLPIEDVGEGVLTASEKRTHCPYKGDATYWHVRAGGTTLEDAAFTYADPFDGARRVAGRVSFLHEEVEVEIQTQMTATTEEQRR